MNKHKEKIVKDTMNEAIEILNKKGKCFIERPTGFGKTFIAMNISKHFKHIIFVYKYDNMIKDLLEKYSNITVNLDITFMSYQKLALYKEDIQIMIEDSEEVLFIFDEAHLMGSQYIKLAVERIQKRYIKSRYLGLSATPYRADGFNIMYNFFDNNCVSPYNMKNAIEDKIFKKPYYVLGTFEVEKECEYYKDKIGKIKNENILLESLNKNLIQNSKLNEKEILDKYINKLIKDKNYMKFMVFFPTKEILNDKIDNQIKIFNELFPDYNINPIIITSDTEYSKNIDILPNLYKRDKTIDLIFSIDMLTLGYHVDDVNGIIMLRPTESSTIYTQQIGRAINIKSNINTVIFDFVGNYNKKQYTVSDVVSVNNNYKRLIDEVFGMNNIHIYDELTDFSYIERIVNDNKNFLKIFSIVDAYVNQNAPIEFCCNYLKISENIFMEYVESLIDTIKGNDILEII